MRLGCLTATTVISLATLLTACGKPVTKDERTFTSAKQKSADAKGEDGTDASEGEDHASCLTFWLHEDHCAVGDETADDFANAGDDTPDSDSGDTRTDDTPADDTPTDDAPADDTPADEPDTPPPPAEDPAVVEFRIKAGTGSNPWNTMDAPMNVKVGQTLRIVNDDTINHRMHTGGQPCPHQPNNMAPGGAYNCVVNSAYDPATGSPMYDHIAGPTARFYIKATP